MNTREVVRRLRAFREGKPLPRGKTKQFSIAEDEDVLILTFLRMGGESRPWGMAFGHPGEAPRILTVPEGRNRDLVAGMAMEFAPHLLQHLRIPGYTASDPLQWEDLTPLRQVWLPNATHLNMVHHLAYAYAFTKYGEESQELLNAFGRACSWLFRESQRPGSMSAMVASQVLNEAFTFPSEDLRQAHLGFLLAWLEIEGGREERMAAAFEAEKLSVAASLNPELERDRLQSLVESWGEADRAKDENAKSRLADEIHRLLAPELERRWRLTEQAIGLLRWDPRRTNVGVEELLVETVKEQWFQHNRQELRRASNPNERVFFPSVETDRYPAAAAARFFVHNASADLVEAVLVHDDAELFAEAIAAGDAFTGEIVEVRDEAKSKRSTKPVWVIRDRADRQLRLRTGNQVCVFGLKKRQGMIREFRDGPDGAIDIEVEITNWKTAKRDAPGIHALAPREKALIGETIGMVAAPVDGISKGKSFRIWNKEGPGAWLTHRTPGGLLAKTASEDIEAGEIADQAADAG